MATSIADAVQYPYVVSFGMDRVGDCALAFGLWHLVIGLFTAFLPGLCGIQKTSERLWGGV